ncbi:MAG: 6-phosphogluconolactonase [Bacteroidales bacterium]
MTITISHNPTDLGIAAASLAAKKLREAIKKNGEGRIVVSTGSSQFELFKALITEKIDWTKVEVFHLDEYIGLSGTNKASFSKYLYERFINLVPVRKFHPVDVAGDIAERIASLTAELRKKPIDLGLIGIGVNGHIAFNDPPADFETRDGYIVVNLNDKCKMQQVNEGWFETKNDVPDKAVSMTVWQIMQCESIISVVPHKVKADAVKKTLTQKLTNTIPATMLKKHPDWNLFIDKDSASELIPL